MQLEDSYRHKGMRLQLVEGLRKKGIQDEYVLDAILRLPRHLFMDKAFDDHAYEDKPFPIGREQTISQPFTVAYQTELLEVQPNDKILEIGTGSGYQASVLYLMNAKVYSIERQEFLYKKTKALLQTMGYRGIKLYWGDGYEGLEHHAPFDKILLTAGCEEIPKKLLLQLNVGGILVAPIGIDDQIMTKIIRKTDKDFEKFELDKFIFVPFVKGIVKE